MLKQISRKVKDYKIIVIAFLTLALLLCLLLMGEHNSISSKQVTIDTSELSTEINTTTASASASLSTTPINETFTNVTPAAVLPENNTLTDQTIINQQKPQWQIIKISKGETAATIFSKLKLDYQVLNQILRLSKAKSILTHLKVGSNLYYKQNQDGQLLKLKYPFNERETLFVKKKDNQYIATIKSKQFASQVLYKKIAVGRSLSTSIQNAGLSKQMYSQLTNIFKNTINFKKEIRPGASFNILYEEFYLDGKKHHVGNILLANLISRGKTYQAIRYTDPKGHSAYYTPNGKELSAGKLEALFLNAPLRYKRISSRFSLHRFDPYIHKVRPHIGVDFAATWGTPVQSIGEGQVIFKGRKGGFGNTVIIKYGPKYKALYGHLSRFANVRPNQSVHKGQVIGYVGNSGWSTGPHLHYTWYVYNIPVDPLKYQPRSTYLPPNSIPNKYKNDFMHRTKGLLATLKVYQRPNFASNQNNSKSLHE